LVYINRREAARKGKFSFNGLTDFDPEPLTVFLKGVTREVFQSGTRLAKNRKRFGDESLGEVD